jgi:dTDP-glucose 4,6-dehydratase
LAPARARHRGAGFIGSHLCARLIEEGSTVIAIDNLLTGRCSNIEPLLGHERFSFLHYDVTNYLHVDGELDAILHFASPASPADFERLPIQILKVGSLGTHKALGLAKAKQRAASCSRAPPSATATRR